MEPPIHAWGGSAFYNLSTTPFASDLWLIVVALGLDTRRVEPGSAPRNRASATRSRKTVGSGFGAVDTVPYLRVGQLREGAVDQRDVAVEKQLASPRASLPPWVGAERYGIGHRGLTGEPLADVHGRLPTHEALAREQRHAVRNGMAANAVGRRF